MKLRETSERGEVRDELCPHQGALLLAQVEQPSTYVAHFHPRAANLSVRILNHLPAGTVGRGYLRGFQQEGWAVSAGQD